MTLHLRDVVEDLLESTDASATGIVWHIVKSPLEAKSATCAKLVPKASDFTAFESEFAWEEEASDDRFDPFYEEIVPPDDRQLIRDTREVPFRWVCSVHSCGTFPASTKKKPAVFRGSGTLIGPRHVLTSAHVLFNYVKHPKEKAQRIGPFWKTAIVVTPGRDGAKASLAARRPFGFAFARRIGVTREWFDKLSATKTPPPISAAKAKTILDAVAEFDYGLIELDRAIGDRTFAVLGGRRLGFWGSPRDGFQTHLGLDRPASFFNGVKVNLCGYPGDKCRGEPPTGSLTAAQRSACLAKNRFDLGSTQWNTFERVLKGAIPGRAGLMLYEHDTKSGHSGSPVWLRWQTHRSLIAVHRGVAERGKSNIGVRITPPIAARIRSWMS
jgi:V8-like Glu-specific endopeptidase